MNAAYPEPAYKLYVLPIVELVSSACSPVTEPVVLKHCRYATMPEAATPLAVAEPLPVALINRYIWPPFASEKTESNCVPGEFDADVKLLVPVKV